MATYSIHFGLARSQADADHAARVQLAQTAYQAALSTAQDAYAGLPANYPAFQRAVAAAEATRAATIASSDATRQSLMPQIAAAQARLGGGTFGSIADAAAAIATVGFTGRASVTDLNGQIVG